VLGLYGVCDWLVFRLYGLCGWSVLGLYGVCDWLLVKVILKERESHELSPTCDTPLSASSDVPQLNLFHTSDFMSVDCTSK
jgi:hypothetical protein